MHRECLILWISYTDASGGKILCKALFLSLWVAFSRRCLFNWKTKYFNSFIFNKGVYFYCIGLWDLYASFIPDVNLFKKLYNHQIKTDKQWRWGDSKITSLFQVSLIEKCLFFFKGFSQFWVLWRRGRIDRYWFESNFIQFMANINKYFNSIQNKKSFDKEPKKTFKERLNEIQEICLKIQEKMDFIGKFFYIYL